MRENVALAPMTTLGVGGQARFFIEVKDEEGLASALEWAGKHGAPPTVLAGGSNVLVSDRGIDGLVVRLGMRGVREVPSADPAKVALEVGAGERLDDLVRESVRLGRAGLECLSGIPGSVGATPIQNVGAYGQEIGETVVFVRVMERRTRDVHLFDNVACGFSYRSSTFKGHLRDEYVVLSVTLALTPGGVPTLRYPDLSRDMTARGGDPPSLEDVRQAVLSIRRSKSMVIDASDPNRRSAGSFFMNPVVTAAEAEAIAEAWDDASQPMPRFAAGDQVKLSAAWLIEHAGFPKGTSDGPVGLSTRHALAIVNRGGATASDILGFAARVRAGVHGRFGVSLRPEPVLLGFSDEEAHLLGV